MIFVLFCFVLFVLFCLFWVVWGLGLGLGFGFVLGLGIIKSKRDISNFDVIYCGQILKTTGLPYAPLLFTIYVGNLENALSSSS